MPSKLLQAGGVLVALAAFGCGATATPEAATPAAGGKPAPAMAKTGTVELLDAEDPIAVDAVPRDVLGRKYSRGGTLTPRLQNVAFDLESLPIRAAETAPVTTNYYPLPSSGSPSKDVSIVARAQEYGYAPYQAKAIKTTSMKLLSFKLGSSYQPLTADGANVYCGFSYVYGTQQTYYGNGAQYAEWEMLGDGVDGPSYVVAKGTFDAASCKLQETGRKEIKVKAIVPKLVYGSQTCEELTTDGKDCVRGKVIHFIFPAARAVAASRQDAVVYRTPNATRVSLPVRKGTAESLQAEVGINEIKTWGDAKAPTNTSYAYRYNARVVMSVEIVQSSQDARATAVAYVGSDGERLDTLFPGVFPSEPSRTSEAVSAFGSPR